MRGWLLSICLLFSMTSHGWQYDTDTLKVRWVWPQQQAFVGEEVAVAIELATPNWFAQAADITLPLDDAALWMQTDNFAQNARLQINQQMWTLQRWSLTLIPRRAGLYSEAQLSLVVGVATQDGSSLLHSVKLSAPSLQVIAKSGNIMVADRLSIERRLDIPEQLTKGSSFSVTYQTQGDGLLAMFLPDISPKFIGSARYKVYAGLPTLKNERERGQQRATREQRFDVVMLDEGDLTLLSQQVNWIQRQDRVTQYIALPELVIVPLEQSPISHADVSHRAIWVALLLVSLAMSGLAMLAPNVMTPLDRQRYTLRKAILQAVQQGDWQTVAASLYRLRDCYRFWRTMTMTELLSQCCESSDAQRIEEMVTAAYSGGHLYQDAADVQRFKRLFKRLKNF